MGPPGGRSRQTATWPDDLTDEVPQFVGGTIERVVKTRGQDESWTYNIYVAGLAMDDVDGYEGALKAMG